MDSVTRCESASAGWSNRPVEDRTRPPAEVQEPIRVPIRVVVRPSFWQLLRQIFANVVHWVGGQLLIAAILTVIYAIGFALAGLPWWWAFALINGFFHLIPMLGAALGLAFPFVGWLLLTDNDPFQFLAIIGVYVGAQAFESFYLTPKILGYKLRLKPFLVFIAVIFGSSVFGFFGALLAAPVLAIAMTIWRWWYDHRQPS